jgi:hypothetical protein
MEVTPILFLLVLFLLGAVGSEMCVLETPLAEPTLALEAGTAALVDKTMKQAAAALEDTLARAEEVAIEAIVPTGQRQGQAAVVAAEEAADHQKQEAAAVAALVF